MHAYLIMAHDNIKWLLKLIKALDDKRNDIYIHVDVKSRNIDVNLLSSHVSFSGIYNVERMNCSWGDYTQIACEISLLKAAIKNKHYDYLHLLSGSDFPIKSQNYIHDFFDSHAGKEFVHFETENIEQQQANREKLHFYYPLQKYISNTRGCLYYIQRIFVYAQRILGLNRIRNIKIQFAKGSNWFSITNDFAAYVLEHETWIKKYFMIHCVVTKYFYRRYYTIQYIKKIYILIHLMMITMQI